MKDSIGRSPLNRDEVEIMYNIFSNEGWVYIEERINKLRFQAIEDLLTAGKDKHEYHVGRIRGFQEVLGLRSEFMNSWKQLVENGLI